MKNFLIVLGVIVLCFTLFSGVFEVKDECIRIHIRANSNNAVDQNVKYAVKDAIVSYLTPIVGEESSFEGAKGKVQENLEGIERVAERVLAQYGYSYGAKAELKREEFPTRSYEGYTLEEGVYEALIVELGEGEGNNWWCVLFPPLCFTPSGKGETIEYRSKIAELCQKIFG